MRTVLYHNDLDGFASAWVHHHLAGNGAATTFTWGCGYEPPPATAYLSINHGDQLPESLIRSGSNVIFLDFCPPPKQIDYLLDPRGMDCQLAIIDHHKTSEEIYLEYKDRPNVRFKFDTKHSGCILTWQAFSRSPTRIPRGLELIEDRDLWKFKYPETKAFCLYMDSLERSFKTWREAMIPSDGIVKAVQHGKSMLRYQGVLVRRMAAEAVRVETCKDRDWMFSLSGLKEDAYSVMIVNASVLQSEVCALLLEEYPDVAFVASYSANKSGKTWQLRSLGDFDVSKIAKSHGGGGHKNAAGFTKPS